MVWFILQLSLERKWMKCWALWMCLWTDASRRFVPLKRIWVTWSVISWWVTQYFKDNNRGDRSNRCCLEQIAATDSDLALLNSGTLRSDRVHPVGPFTLGDLNTILPMLDPLVVIEVTGWFSIFHLGIEWMPCISEELKGSSSRLKP